MNRTRITPFVRPGPAILGLGMLAAALLALPAPAGAQARLEAGCALCHGELEFLRAQAGSLSTARTLLVTAADVRASAHAGMDCGECHAGFARFPHQGPTTTRSCASCHAAQDSVWRTGIHADTTNAEPVSCASCHGIHSVATAAELREPAGAGRANARCTECHQSSHLAPDNPHARDVLCAGCHAAHDTKRVDDGASQVAPENQFRTCSACHEEATRGWPEDAHGKALLEGGSADGREEPAHGPPACTACHGAHEMRDRTDPAFSAELVARCSACHEDEAHRYLETYHGQASALGSEIVATCHACHGSHGIRAASDPASTVAEANLIDTCSACHEQARASFVLYDSHPDPGDRERSPLVYYTFLFMNLLLLGVFGVFGVHTFLWWLRLLGKGKPEDGGPHG